MLTVAALLVIAQVVTPSPRAVGVLVGVQRLVDYQMQSRAARQPPAGGELRTIWISAGGAEPVVPIEIPVLLLPRRAGFWRLGLLGSCAEEPHKTADDQIDGVETVFGDDLWAAPLGVTPKVRIELKNWLGVPVQVGPCKSREVYCSVDRRIAINWIWPEYVSLNRGTESGCGAHPDGSTDYTVERIDRLGSELTIAEALGRATERRFERALTAAVKQSAECGEPAHFQPTSWRIFRVPGGWKPEGWSDTHRLCGYGVDFTVDVDLSRITGRKPDQARWLALKHRMPQLTDAHFSADGRWIVATTDSELLFLDSAVPGRPAARIPLDVSDSLVMVEWAPGANVARWNMVVQRARAEGAVTPLVAPTLLQSTLTAGQRQSSGRTTADPAAHWPRFRGPSSNPISENPNLPVSWSKTENVEWVADVPGVGWSSPVVWGNRVFITAATSDKPMKQPSLGVDFSNEYLAELRKQGLSAAEANKKLYERDREMPDEIVISLMLYCYDLGTGKKLWERQMYKGRPAGGRHSKNSFASETPTTDGERVYVYLTDYGLFAYDFAGKLSWTTPLKAHATTRDWGTGASAALHKDRLFVLNDNEEQSFVAAFDTRTGKELWRTPRSAQPARKSGWSTPFVWENRVRTELVTLGPGVAISYSLDGKELWRMNRMGGYAIQSPFAWNDLLFVTSGAGGDDNRPIVAVRAGGSGDITPPAAETKNEHVVWYDRTAGGTYLPTPVIYRNALYVLNDKGIFSRRNPETGERIYQSRVAPGAAAFTASPWAYNGHVFVMSEEGDTFVIEAANEYRLVRTNSLDDFSMATPAIVGDRLLIRTQHRLYSIRNRK